MPGYAEATSILFLFSSEDGSTFDITSVHPNASWSGVDGCVWTGTNQDAGVGTAPRALHQSIGVVLQQVQGEV